MLVPAPSQKNDLLRFGLHANASAGCQLKEEILAMSQEVYIAVVGIIGALNSR
jgi:hypothetical protein